LCGRYIYFIHGKSHFIDFGEITAGYQILTSYGRDKKYMGPSLAMRTVTETYITQDF